MIQVSNEFKTAIKKAERQIKGYVEVLYDLPQMNVTSIDSYAISSHTSLLQINDGNRVTNLYGSLDYLPLDGSRLTMGTTNENAGIISEEAFENIAIPEIVFYFDETTVNGITLYYRTNIPTSLEINCSDGTQKIVTNDKECIQIIFDEPKVISSLSIYINSVEYPNRKLYLNEVDLGITQVYKDQDLIEFTVDEEVNKLVEEVPINETNIILNNMTNLFNPLNPQGVIPYLSKNTLIKPYIGVLTENTGIEYVKMGEFYFDSYINNSDSTTNLVGKNIIKQLENEYLIDNNEFNLFKSTMSKANFQTYMQNYSYVFNNLDFTPVLATFNIDKDKLLDFIKEICFINSNLFYADRDNKLNIKTIDNTIVDNLTKYELIEDAEYTVIDKINTLVFKNPVAFSMNVTGSRLVYENTITLEKSPQIVLCKSFAPNLKDSIVHADGADSVSVISQGYFMEFIKLTGTIGSSVHIQIASSYEIVQTIGEKIKTVKNANERENIIEFKTSLSKSLNNINILNYTPSYKMAFNYNGDPSLEAGDYISVQTPYGYKPLFIQKNHFKFDGGLEGRIEGVE